MIAAPCKSVPQRLFAAVMSDAPSRVTQVASRWAAVPGGLVDGGEIVLLAVKPSLWRPVLDAAAWLVTSTVLAIALLVLGVSIPGLSPSVTAQVVLLVGITRLAIAVLRWVTMWHLLTNRRIIDVHGVRTPVIRGCLLVQVRNTYLRPTPIEGAIGLGSILFVTDEPGELPHVWRSLADPQTVHAKIRRAIESALDQHIV